jgi:hypothetical protein
MRATSNRCCNIDLIYNTFARIKAPAKNCKRGHIVKWVSAKRRSRVLKSVLRQSENDFGCNYVTCWMFARHSDISWESVRNYPRQTRRFHSIDTCQSRRVCRSSLLCVISSGEVTDRPKRLQQRSPTRGFRRDGREESFNGMRVETSRIVRRAATRRSCYRA